MEPEGTIRNIIFDLGGVFFGVDYRRQEAAFRQAGFADYGRWYSQLKQDELFDNFETGSITVPEFRDRIRKAARMELSDSLIDECWNSILLGMPSDALELIRKVSTRYRIFLLSNTNALHETGFRKMLDEQYGSGLPESLFEKVYLSHRVGMRKPDPGIFKFVLHDSGLVAQETVFIDDSPQHVEGACAAGITGWWLQEPMNTGRLLQDKGLI